MPWFPSHSQPLLWSVPFGNWPGGFLLSALPTQPWHGSPVAAPLLFPLRDARPSQVLAYWFPLVAEPPLPLKAWALELCGFGQVAPEKEMAFSGMCRVSDTVVTPLVGDTV